MRAFLVLLSFGLLLAAPLFPPAVASTDPIEEALDNVSVLARPGAVGHATVWDGNAFVQCRRDKAGAMRCEAAGSLMQPSLKGVLTAERKVVLETEGWSLEPAFGLYVQSFPADVPVPQIVGKVRAALVRGYGADPARFEVETSWFPDTTCPPRVMPAQNLAGRVANPRAAPTMTRALWSYAPVDDQARTRQVETADDLVRLYGPRLTAEIQRLRIYLRKAGFVTVSAGIEYVQCAPEDAPPGLYCEAQSADSWAALASVLTPDRVARLRGAGYSEPGRSPNSWKIDPAESGADAAIARELLDILYSVYGYRGRPALSSRPIHVAMTRPVARHRRGPHSHSMVPGGFEVTS